MADRKIYKIKDDNSGQIQVADEVVAIIAGLAATEVDGVDHLGTNLTNEVISRLGSRVISKGVKVEITDQSVEVDIVLYISYGYSIPVVSSTVQEKVSTAIETMTGMKVTNVNIRIAGVEMDEQGV